MTAPMPLLRPALGAASDTAQSTDGLMTTTVAQGVEASTRSPPPHQQQHTGSLLHPSSEPRKVVHFFAPASSSSNGETLVHLSELRGDTTVDRSAHNSLVQPGQRGNGGLVTSIDLSSLPQWAEVEGNAEVADTPVSPVASTVESAFSEVSSSRDAAASPEVTPVQHVWTRHVQLDPPSFSPSPTHSDRSSVALSEAAATMVAQALRRASLLQRCLARWQDRLESHAQWRLRCECFAEGYYQRNLRYLFFRAWQWRFARRLQHRVQQRALQEVRVRSLQRRVVHAWRQWVKRRAHVRACVDALCVRHSKSLLLRHCAKWRQAATQRALARAVAAASADTLCADRFQHWLHVALERVRRRLLVRVVQVHTPTAWGSAEKLVAGRRAGAPAPAMVHLTCHDLLRRDAWLQWLRVAMLRRGRRLQRRAEATSRVALRTVRTLQRARYVRWLQVTFAALQARHGARQLLHRYWAAWVHVGELRKTGSEEETLVRLPAIQRRCLDCWRSRVLLRTTVRAQHQTAAVFHASVVQARVVRAVFLTWKDRHATRVKQQRMRRVAEGYARPALLRHLFLRHVTDGVLAMPIRGLDETEEEAAEGLMYAPCADEVSNRIGEATWDRTRARQRQSGLNGARRLRHAIPLSADHACPLPLPPQQRLALTDGSEKSQIQDTSVHPLPEASTAPQQLAAVASSCETHAETALSPPPPSYEEVMLAKASTRTLAGLARADVGVGTESAVQLLVDNAAPFSREAERSSAPERAHTRIQRCERGTGTPPPPWTTTPMTGAVWPAAPLPYAVPHGFSCPWALAWPAPGSVAASARAAFVSPSACVPPWQVWPEAPTPSSRSPQPPQLTPHPHSDLVASAGVRSSEEGARASRVPSEQFTEGPQAAVPMLQCGARERSATPPSSTPRSTGRQRGAGERASDVPRVVTDAAGRAKGSASARHRGRSVPAAEGLVATGDRNVLGHGRMQLRLAAAAATGASRATHSRSRGDAHMTQCRSESSSLSSFSSSSTDSVVQPSPREEVEAVSSFSALQFPIPGVSSTRRTDVRAQVRRVLDDYKTRTRMIGAEKTELHAIDAQLALPSASVGVRAADALRARQRYLQQRVLEWEQRRAQVAQLAVWLEGRVSSAATSAAVSSAGGV